MWIYVSHCMVVSDIASGTTSSLNADCEDCRRAMSGSVFCATTIALKSMTGGESSSNALVSILDKVSAGMLSTPFTCLMLVVNCWMKSRWQVCRGECLW